MKRSENSDNDKEVKKQKLLQQLGGQQIPYLTPADEGFQELWKTKYSKLALREAHSTPPELHGPVQTALSTLLERGCLFRDLVQMKGKDMFTPVSRVLIGAPGHTYKYLNTRLFTIPWPTSGAGVRYCDDEVARACQAVKDLNDYLCVEAERCLTRREGAQSTAETTASVTREKEREANNRTVFNVTLLNYMDPTGMSYLKEEPYFGMGRMAVSWHHDENLVDHSPVAVYSYSYKDAESCSTEGDEKPVSGRDCTMWHVALKVAWDVHTAGLALPLHSGDCYFMLDDLNMTHQHCVLAGVRPRFSSTHRVAECSAGTLEYIFGRCQVALNNLHKDPSSERPSLVSLETSVLKQAEEIHNEVEFEWLRQYWFQGRRYAKISDWWCKPMERLEECWREMELMRCWNHKRMCDTTRAPEKQELQRHHCAWEVIFLCRPGSCFAQWKVKNVPLQTGMRLCRASSQSWKSETSSGSTGGPDPWKFFWI
ncbi:alpha-ketoglutarate-dependent dioxygenase FTO-like isoform X3 [Acipenser ruthenus]|uniref:alpha-ketoglutarate-dependent dioxygenase FTO-like isoform X3 n=1 Tax=Acipenser ruthenus TaxID=7906 RepID=UPI0027404606|nr:alpha-ketoglutarate-dependent dioxygenase FTO-like isoform X3 [Acipenser ruthenus]